MRTAVTSRPPRRRRGPSRSRSACACGGACWPWTTPAARIWSATYCGTRLRGHSGGGKNEPEGLQPPRRGRVGLLRRRCPPASAPAAWSCASSTRRANTWGRSRSRSTSGAWTSCAAPACAPEPRRACSSARATSPSRRGGWPRTDGPASRRCAWWTGRSCWTCCSPAG